MFYKIKPMLFVLLLASLLVACATPATAVPTYVPIVATAVPAIPVNQITIPVGEGEEDVKATIIGNGDIAVVMHKTIYDTDTMSRWTPLIDSLSANEKLRMVLYTLRNVAGSDIHDASSPDKDSNAVFDYLRSEGINKIICISAGLPSVCADLQNEPEMIGLVAFPPEYVVSIEAGFPKLFITAETEPNGWSGNLQQTYENSAEPKTFKSYPVAVAGPVIFINADVGPQALADVTDFINGIVNSQ